MSACRSIPRTASFVVLLAVSAGTHAFTFQYGESEVDAAFRAKIAKQRVKIDAMDRQARERGESLDNNSQLNDSDCGNQNIGVTNTSRGQQQPREIFVFAPNAINLAGTNCR